MNTTNRRKTQQIFFGTKHKNTNWFKKKTNLDISSSPSPQFSSLASSGWRKESNREKAKDTSCCEGTCHWIPRFHKSPGLPQSYKKHHLWKSWEVENTHTFRVCKKYKPNLANNVSKRHMIKLSYTFILTPGEFPRRASQ